MPLLWIFTVAGIERSAVGSADAKWQASLQIGGQPFLLKSSLPLAAKSSALPSFPHGTMVLQSATANAKRSALPRPTLLYYAPLLKSALQKAIRRRRTASAVAIAYQFLRQEPVEFLRRLPIYMLEDTYLQPRALVRCVWLMCAVYKGWRLTEADIRFLLGVVRRLCALDYKERLCREPCDTLEDALGGLKGALSPLEAGAVATWVRSEFGGLKGDMAFLRNLASVWLERDAEGWELEEAAEESWTGPFPGEEGLYLLEGVDFHCYPHLRKTLIGMGWRGGREMDEETFRQQMWIGQSGVNRRSWLFEDGEGEGGSDAEEGRKERKEAKAVMTSVRPFLETFARMAWQPQKAPKTIGEYFGRT
jgi:hypothetical protein